MNWTIAIISSFIIGLSRGGLKGLAPLFALLMAAACGAKYSVGIVVPLLLVGDVLALFFYRKYISWKFVVSFLPWVLIGVILGVWIGNDLPEPLFKKGLAIIILGSLLLMMLSDYYFKKKILVGLTLTSLTGLGAGTCSMLGNFTGAFANIYFLMTRLPKKELIGTATFIFFIVNIFKLPFHICVWETISLETLISDVKLFPIVIVGFFVGLKLVDMINEYWFRKFLYGVTFIGVIIVLVN